VLSSQGAANWRPRYWAPRKYSISGIRFGSQANLRPA